MEDLLVSAKEHKLLKKFQKQLEELYRVKIRMPKASTLDSDVVFISICGETHNRDCIKKFLLDKMKQLPQNNEYKENVVIITLSDREEETVSALDNSINIIETSSYSKKSSQEKKQTMHNDDFLCIDENSVSIKHNSEVMRNVFNQRAQFQKKRHKRNYKTNKKVRSHGVLSSSDVGVSGFCEVTSTTNDVVTRKIFNDGFHSMKETITSTENPSTSNPLQKYKHDGKAKNDKNSCLQEQQDQVDVFIIEPVRRLRPIVIDGNNVAKEHGKVFGKFSPIGIKLVIEYFMERGHTQITALVPQYRRFKTCFKTVDHAVLEELAEKKLVIFTPSRIIKGKRVTSYDDKLIVELAARSGGVIVSNKQYRKLINVSESFKETIEQRLLMYILVDDIFVPPPDPLGRYGPTLEEFLSFD